jgi:hypothetical protein
VVASVAISRHALLRRDIAAMSGRQEHCPGVLSAGFFAQFLVSIPSGDEISRCCCSWLRMASVQVRLFGFDSMMLIGVRAFCMRDVQRPAPF